MTTDIIAFVGLIGSGKDTCVQYLIDHHGFKKESFASSLKDAVAAVFGWDRALLEGATAESRAWREQVDTWWANRLHKPHLTPRWVLQYWGTEVCRHGFADDIWIASAENRMRQGGKFALSDCRFPNEFKMIKQLGGKIVRIQRGADPDWFEVAAAANQGDANALTTMHASKIHISEWAWVGLEFDAVIENNGTLDELKKQVRNLVL